MNYKHHHAAVSRADELANGKKGASFNSRVIAYDTRNSYPSEGAAFRVYNEGNYSSTTPPTKRAYNDANLVSYGQLGNLIFDWNGGGPEGVTETKWQVLLGGTTIGSDLPTNTDITFKAVYSGNIVLSVSNTVGSYFTNNPSTDLGTVLIDDWEYSGGSSIKTSVVSTTISGANPLAHGGLDFRVRYWNGCSNPHLLLFIKREGVDPDFVLMGPSSISTAETSLVDSTRACQKHVIGDVLSWNIKRDHDQITNASVDLYIDTNDSTNTYDPTLDKFGVIGKNTYIEIEAGYDGQFTKRFVGNVSNGVEVSRDKHGAVVSLECEGILAFMLDTINFSFPNNATYSYSDYTTNTNIYTEPDGLERPSYFDQWDLNKLIKALALQSGIDSKYLSGYRKLFLENNDITTTNTPLIRDLGINLSRNKKDAASLTNINYEEPDPIWEYDFGQDTAYDIIKDVLSKYGFYINDIASGEDCGNIELVEIESAIDTIKTINSGLSSSYTENQKVKSAVGFLATQMDANSSELIIDWTGTSVDLVMGIGPQYSDSVAISYKVSPGDADWTSMGGYLTDGTYISTSTISTQNTDLTDSFFYYDGINTASGDNPTVFKLAYSIDNNGFLDTDIPYGHHQLRLTKTSTETAMFDCLFVYDFGNAVYKKYSTYDTISKLNVNSSISDIRNDIVVLGASYGAFSNTADPDDLEEVEDKYIVSRIVDTRSIYDPTYKYYVGRRKQFVIEDPTIVTQERADWLALYVLKTYRQTPTNVSVSIPADLGLQLYDSALFEEVKTYSVDKYKAYNITSISEVFNNKEYNMDIVAASQRIPFSFRPRRYIDSDTLRDVFDNCPIAFEKMTVPVLADRTGYDPMSSEDGLYIDFEWTQLVPGKVNIEVFDRKVVYDNPSLDIRAPYYGRGTDPSEGSADQLIAVPFISQGDEPGTYSARWDGVHEYYAKNTKFSGTEYELSLELPNGHGFFARKPGLSKIDSVNPVALDNNDERAAKLTYFPVYPIAYFQPVSSDFLDASNVYHFGSANGSSSVNGVLNSSNDITVFEISEFDLEPRVPLFWGFNENYIRIPSDASNFLQDSDHPFTKDSSSVFVASNYETNESTHSVLEYDYRLPHGFTGEASDATRPLYRHMPLLDETVGIRLFEDSSVAVKRRYQILRGDVEFHVITVLNDYMNYFAENFSLCKKNGDLYECETNPYPMSASRCYNFVNRYRVPEVSIEEFNLSTQKLPFQEWSYLPSYSDRSSAASEVFVFKPSQDAKILNKFDSACIRRGNPRYRGVSVDNVFAVPFNKLGSFIPSNTETELPYCISRYDYVPYQTNLEYPSSDWSQIDPGTATVPAYLTNSFFDHPEAGGNAVRSTSGTDEFLNKEPWVKVGRYYGQNTAFRKLYNAIVISLDFQIIDRAGRLYHSVAKADSGRFMLGRHNEVEVHSEYGKDMLPFVNRWNPYLPTVCYMTPSPSSFDMTDFGGSTFDFYKDYSNYYGDGWFDFTKVNNFYPEYPDGTNLTDQIIHHLPNNGNSILFNYATTTAPFYTLYKSHGSMPLLSSGGHVDGVRYGIFGGDYQTYNSNVFSVDDAESNYTRDSSNIDDNQNTWGLPLYVTGGHPYRRFTGSSTTYWDETHICPAGSTFARWRYVLEPVRLGSSHYAPTGTRVTPGYANDSDLFDATVYAAPINYAPIEHTPSVVRQRGGVFSFLNNSPVFVQLSGAKYIIDVNYPGI